MIIAKYKFNSSIYSNLLPVFNSKFTAYTTSDVSNDDGTVIRTIESDTLPTKIRFGDDTATDRAKSLLEVVSINISSLTDMINMFRNCSNLTTIEGINNWNTSSVTNMSAMFNGCSKLTQLDLNNWDTSSLTNISYMFQGCTLLTKLDLNNWNTSSVTNMSAMFNSCSKLTQLDVSNWDTSKVTTMVFMFNNCPQLTQLDLSNWDTSKVTNMGAMFRDSSKLTTIGDISNWDTSSVTTMTSMFYNCFKLTQLDISNWDTSKVTNMASMFYNCPQLTQLDLSNWDTSNVTNMSQMFNNCDSLYKVNLKYSNEATVSKIHESLPDRSSLTKGYILSSLDLTSDKNWMVAKLTHNKLNLPQPLRKIGNIKDKFYWDDDKGHYCIEQNISDTLEVLETPNIIDLPHLNKKYSFDIYLPNTSVKVGNSLLQPYSLLLESDTVRYKSTIEPSTLYTIQFNCLEKSTTNLTLDLGGSRVTIDPIIGLNHVQITTPSELASDRLFLIGTGIIVKEVIVNKGDVTQYPKYFDGEQSVGVLQGDNTYKIDIKTNEDFIISIKTDLPLTKDDKLYWNDTNKRYEIDRSGEIEIPTVEGDVIDLPRLYQKKPTTIIISTDNIEPSKIDISYKDIH